jgi:hypothetical protein
MPWYRQRLAGTHNAAGYYSVLGFFWTIAPGLVIAARVRPVLMGWAFVGLTLGALLWIAAAYLAHDYALLGQNIVIALINCLGIYRWRIWKGKA